MASYTDLLKKYDNLYQSRECDNEANKKAPGRCIAAKDYRKDLNKFVKDAISEEEKTIPVEIKLMNDRINNKDHKNIYPLINYDFNYNTAFKKELNPYKLGITNQPTFTNYINGTFALKNYLDYMVQKPFPNDNTIAGITDTVIENKNKKAIIDRKKEEDNKLPYKSFRKDYPECLYPTTGKYSSSYFIKIGTCPTKIINKDDCINRGYEWVPENKPASYISDYINTYDPDVDKNIPAPDTKIPPPLPEKGSCFKPRFSYIDNSAKGLLGLEGVVPSTFNEINSVRPDKLANMMAGYNIGGSGVVPCSIEEFTNNKSNINYSVILLLGTILVVLYMCDKK
jgi:hypothetical protein